jgi:hypothetical protein
METTQKYQIKSEKGYYALSMKGNVRFIESQEMGYLLTESEAKVILASLLAQGFSDCQIVPFTK